MAIIRLLLINDVNYSYIFNIHAVSMLISVFTLITAYTTVVLYVFSTLQFHPELNQPIFALLLIFVSFPLSVVNSISVAHGT